MDRRCLGAPRWPRHQWRRPDRVLTADVLPEPAIRRPSGSTIAARATGRPPPKFRGYSSGVFSTWMAPWKQVRASGAPGQFGERLECHMYPGAGAPPGEDDAVEHRGAV